LLTGAREGGNPKDTDMARKKYSIVVDEDEVISIEVNGVKYDSWIEIPDNIDQQRVEKMASAATKTFKDEDFSTRTSNSLGMIIVPVFGVVALILLAVALISGIGAGRAMSREVSAPGRVTSLHMLIDSEGSQVYYPVVAFTLPDHSINTVEMNEGSSPPSYSVGQDVTVLYDPANPNQARIKSIGGALGMWALAIITGLMGVIFLGAAVLAWWMLRPEKTRK
jgi:hypothetical protein